MLTFHPVHLRSTGNWSCEREAYRLHVVHRLPSYSIVPLQFPRSKQVPGILSQCIRQASCPTRPVQVIRKLHDRTPPSIPGPTPALPHPHKWHLQTLTYSFPLIRKYISISPQHHVPVPLCLERIPVPH